MKTNQQFTKQLIGFSHWRLIFLLLFLSSVAFAQKNANPGFYGPGTWGNLSLTTSLQTVTTGQTNDSDIVVLFVTNESGAASQVTFADENGNTLAVLQVQANAGQNESTPPADMLKPNFLPGCEVNPYGGFLFYLPASKFLQAKINSVSGGARRLFWKRKDY